MRKSYTLTESVIFDRIKLQVNRIFYDNDLRITPETKLIDDLGADSLELLEFNLALENAFDIMILDKTDNKSSINSSCLGSRIDSSCSLLNSKLSREESGVSKENP